MANHTTSHNHAFSTRCSLSANAVWALYTPEISPLQVETRSWRGSLLRPRVKKVQSPSSRGCKSSCYG